MFECPHCHERSIGLVQKLSIGTANPTHCKQCGKRVGIPNQSLLLFIPTFILMFFILRVANLWLKILLFALLIAVFFYIQLRHVKLIAL